MSDLEIHNFQSEEFPTMGHVMMKEQHPEHRLPTPEYKGEKYAATTEPGGSTRTSTKKPATPKATHYEDE